jgi:hypothetical protein
MNTFVAAVIAHWKAHGVDYLPGVTDDELRAFEKRYDVTLPKDMWCFYKATNGTRAPLSAGQDHESYDFYQLAEVKADEDFPWAMNFADYRELSWSYAIDLSGQGGVGPGTVYFMGAIGKTPLVVAHGFGEFLDLYVRGDARLWPDGAAAYHHALVSDI